MTRETVDISRERVLVTLLIMNDTFAKRIIPIINVKALKVIYSKMVVEWCLDYYEHYSTTPKASIQDIFEKKRSYIQDKEVLESIGAFLESLAEDYEPSDYANIEYYIDDCELYIRENSLLMATEKISSLVQQGKIEQAEQVMATYKRTTIPDAQGVSIIEHTDTIMDAFSEEAVDPLFTLDGDLGDVVGGLYRGDFLAALSRMKGTKSWYLGYVNECAALAGNKVLHVNLEMRDSEMYQRAWRGLVKAPMKDGEIIIPKFVAELDKGEEISDNTLYSVAYPSYQLKGVSFENRDSLKRQMQLRFRGGDIRYVTMPSRSTMIADIEALLDNLLLYDGYHVDVLTIDYCDLLGSPEKDHRHKLNHIWEDLRRVAQERHILVSTVTQTNRSGTGGEELETDNISEDIRKLAHATTFLGIYATKEEMEQQLCHVTCLDTRYKRITWDNAVVLNCLDIGRWHVDSRLSCKLHE